MTRVRMRQIVMAGLSSWNIRPAVHSALDTGKVWPIALSITLLKAIAQPGGFGPAPEPTWQRLAFTAALMSAFKFAAGVGGAGPTIVTGVD